MKIKRTIFILVLIALFMGCYTIMNQHYDELARYPHNLSDKQRKIVLDHLSTDEINTLISQKIQPDQFLPYIEVPGFELDNTLWYDEVYRTQKGKVSKEFVIGFINKYKNKMKFSEVNDLINNYSFNVLIRFFDEGDQYVNNAQLVANPSDKFTLIPNKKTIYTYEPSDLVSVGDLPHNSIVDGAHDILVKAEVLKPLQLLCEAAKEINGQEAGDMEIVAGYLSFEDQVKLLDNAKAKFGNSFKLYWDYPGHNEYQLGYTVQLLPKELQAQVTNKVKDNSKTEMSEGEKEQEIWLRENAYKFGFIIRYPNGGEETTGKKPQPYTLRYVGRDLAKDIHTKNKTLEQMDFSKYK